EKGIPMSLRKRVQRPHVVRVDGQRFSGFADRLVEDFRIILVLSLQGMFPCPEGDFVAGEALRPASSGLQSFGSLYLWCDPRANGSCSFLLDCKDILQHAVVAFRPDVVAGQGVDELGSHTYPIRRPADAALEDVANAEVPADLPDIWRLALV